MGANSVLHAGTGSTDAGAAAPGAVAAVAGLAAPVSATPPRKTDGAPAFPGILVMDTCVLLSNVLRRVFLRLAGQGCFMPVWSERIGGEWRRNASRIWGVPMPDIEAQWAALQEAFPQACQGDVGRYEIGLQRSDPKDWHVIAAGRSAKSRHPGRAAAIVTRNTKDFNRTELRGYGLAMHDPDDMLVRCHAAHPGLMADLLPEVPCLAAGPGQAPDSLEAILKRERLFRLNRLYRSMC